jgi:hypothetical protein
VQHLNAKWPFQFNICHYEHHKVCIVMDEIRKGYLMHVIWIAMFVWKKLHFLVMYYMFKIILHGTRLYHILYTQIILVDLYKVIYSLVRLIVWGSWRKSTIENNGLLRNLEVNQASYGNLQWYHFNSLIFLHIYIYICGHDNSWYNSWYSSITLACIQGFGYSHNVALHIMVHQLMWSIICAIFVFIKPSCSYNYVNVKFVLTKLPNSVN